MSTETDNGGSRTLVKSIKKSEQIAIPEEVVMSKIYEIRGIKVMLDRDPCRTL